MKVHENGRVVIPADIRRLLDIEEGDEVLFSLEGDDRIVLRKVESDEEGEDE